MQCGLCRTSWGILISSRNLVRFTSGALGNNLFTNFADTREEPMVLQFLNYSPAAHTSHLIEDKVKVLIAQSCLTLCDPIYCSLRSYSVHGIPHARILPGCQSGSPVLQADSLPSEPPWKPRTSLKIKRK